MGFFQELKEDLSQAVNELLPEEETGQESKKDDEDKALDDALKEVQEALAAEVGSPDTEEAGMQDEAAEETKDAETADEENNASVREKILERYHAGENLTDVARDLGLGYGEVKLIVELYKGEENL